VITKLADLSQKVRRELSTVLSYFVVSVSKDLGCSPGHGAHIVAEAMAALNQEADAFAARVMALSAEGKTREEAITIAEKEVDRQYLGTAEESTDAA
jgi:hypothetical protein